MEPARVRTFSVLHLYPWIRSEKVRGGPEEVPSQWIKPSFGAEKIYSSSKHLKHTFNSSSRTRCVKKARVQERIGLLHSYGTTQRDEFREHVGLGVGWLQEDRHTLKAIAGRISWTVLHKVVGMAVHGLKRWQIWRAIVVSRWWWDHGGAVSWTGGILSKATIAGQSCTSRAWSARQKADAGVYRRIGGGSGIILLVHHNDRSKWVP